MRPLWRFSIPLTAAALAFLASLFGLSYAQSMPQLPVQWSAPVSSLAEKIAAAAGAPGPLAMSLTNNSSLGAADASAVYDGLLASLRARRFQIAGPALPTPPITRVQVTLSENASRYIWVAQVWTAPGADADPQVAMVSAVKPADRTGSKMEAALTLSRRLIWSQSGRMLDFDYQDTPNPGLVILEPEQIDFYHSDEMQWVLDHAVPVSHARAWPRDLSGAFDVTNGKVIFDGAPCTGDFLHPEGLRCDQLRQNQTGSTNENAIRIQIDGRGTDVVSLGAACQSLGPILLASGTGDWTQPDDLRAYEAAGGPLRALGQPDEFAGPVLALGMGGDGKSARAVVHNLQTGNYEAYVVTASCSQ
jgi:hypothetical protein